MEKPGAASLWHPDFEIDWLVYCVRNWPRKDG